MECDTAIADLTWNTFSPFISAVLYLQTFFIEIEELDGAAAMFVCVGGKVKQTLV